MKAARQEQQQDNWDLDQLDPLLDLVARQIVDDYLEEARPDTQDD